MSYQINVAHEAEKILRMDQISSEKTKRRATSPYLSRAALAAPSRSFTS